MRTYNPAPPTGGSFHARGGSWVSISEDACLAPTPKGYGRTRGEYNWSIGFRVCLDHRMATR